MKYKCKTCKHWDYQGFDVGKCSGILPRTTIIAIPAQPKGKPDAKLITQKGIITNGTFFMTDKNWACINWSKK